MGFSFCAAASQTTLFTTCVLKKAKKHDLIIFSMNKIWHQCVFAAELKQIRSTRTHAHTHTHYTVYMTLWSTINVEENVVMWNLKRYLLHQIKGNWVNVLVNRAAGWTEVERENVAGLEFLTHSWSPADCPRPAEMPCRSPLSWCCSSHLTTSSQASDLCGWMETETTQTVMIQQLFSQPPSVFFSNCYYWERDVSLRAAW